MRRRQQQGFTFIETSMVCGIAAVLASLAAPSFKGSIERHHLDGIAAQLETDLNFARSQAVAQAKTVRVAFHTAAAGSCYLVHTGAIGDCKCDADGQPVCKGAAQPLRTAFLQQAGGIGMTSKPANLTIDGFRQTVSPTATITIVGPSGRSVHVTPNILGRVRACSPGAAVAGYKAC